jgi:Ubiquitin family
MQIFVRADRTYTLDVESLDTVGHAKSLIDAKTGFPATAQRLLYSGAQLVDSKTLAGNIPPRLLTPPFLSQPC